MNEIHRYQVVKMLSDQGNKIAYDPHGPWIVMASDFDRVNAERDSALSDAELWRSRCGAKCYSVTVLRALLERVVTEVGRTITSELRADIDTEMSATRSPEIDAIQQRLTAADERVDVLEGLLREASVELHDFITGRLLERIDDALKPAEGGGDE